MSYDSQTEIANRHDFNATFTAEYDNDQTSATIITPTTGKKLRIHSVFGSGKATSGKVRLHFATSGNTVTTMFAGASGLVANDNHCFIEGALNEPLKLTSTFGAGNNYFVAVDYKEV